MANTREVRYRIRSVKNIAQVTHALQAVSASRVRKAMQMVMNTRPYAIKAWQLLKHVASQPDRDILHPLLTVRSQVQNVMVILISGDRGLAGPYNTNIVRYTLQHFNNYPCPVGYTTIGRKGRDLLWRRGQKIISDFSGLKSNPTFEETSAIGRDAVDQYLLQRADEVYLAYMSFVSLGKQIPRIQKLLPLEVASDEAPVRGFGRSERGLAAAYIYEPGPAEILDKIVPRFTALQVYQAILEAQACEHAARMIAMQNATESANELAAALQLEYNKARQQSITSEMLDITSGAEALRK